MEDETDISHKEKIIINCTTLFVSTLIRWLII